MSVSSTTNRDDYTGNGVADTFTYSFRIFRKEDLLVTQTDTSGVETTLVVDTDYTVSGVRDATGSITLTAGALTTDYTLTIRRVLELKQETDIANQTTFFPETHEDEFDRRVMVAQQQQDEIDRSVKLPESIPSADFDTTLPTDIETADRALVTNSTGDGWTLSLFSVADAERIFKADTYANLKALAIAAPTLLRFGYATDTKQLVFYTTDLTQGDDGWIILG